MPNKFYTKSKNAFKGVFDIFGSGNVIRNISNSGGSITQISSNSGRVSINGKSYKGDNIQINGNKVIIDGVEQDSIEEPEVTIIVNGNCGDITTANGDITVNGSAISVKNTNGRVSIDGDIKGDVKTVNGDIKAKVIEGNCKTQNGNIR